VPPLCQNVISCLHLLCVSTRLLLPQAHQSSPPLPAPILRVFYMSSDGTNLLHEVRDGGGPQGCRGLRGWGDALNDWVRQGPQGSSGCSPVT